MSDGYIGKYRFVKGGSGGLGSRGLGGGDGANSPVTLCPTY